MSKRLDVAEMSVERYIAQCSAWAGKRDEPNEFDLSFARDYMTRIDENKRPMINERKAKSLPEIARVYGISKQALYKKSEDSRREVCLLAERGVTAKCRSYIESASVSMVLASLSSSKSGSLSISDGFIEIEFDGLVLFKHKFCEAAACEAALVANELKRG